MDKSFSAQSALLHSTRPSQPWGAHLAPLVSVASRKKKKKRKRKKKKGKEIEREKLKDNL